MEKSFLQITKSKTRAAILELFFNDPEQEYYLRQIERLIGYSAGNIRREMISLEESGLFAHRMLGKVKLYKLNKDYPIYNDLKNIVRKTISIVGKLRDIMHKHKKIIFTFIHGSFAKGKESSSSDIDIIIIGSIASKAISSELFEYESHVKREINSTIYTEREFLDKLRKRNHFISTIIKEPKIFLKGTEDEFGRFVQIRKTEKT